MPRHSPYQIMLSDEERAALRVVGALVYVAVLASDAGQDGADGGRRDAQRRDRSAAAAAVARSSRSGASGSSSSAWLALRTGHGGVARRFFPPQVRAEVIAIACERPADEGVPLSRWSSPELATRGRGARDRRADQRRDRLALAVPGRDQALAAPLVDLPARPTIRRSSAGPILDLYAGRLAGRAPAPRRLRRLRRREALDPGARGASTRRCPQPRPPARARRSNTSTSARARCATSPHGTPRRAKIFDRCAPKDGIEPFDALVEQFMSHQPYRNAQRVFLIIDNGSAHRGKRSIDRLQGTWPNLIVVHTPIHASWLNQAEIYFSVVQRKVVTPQRLRRPRHARAAPPRVRPPLRADRRALPMEVHPRRPPQRPARQDQPAAQAA